MEPTNPYHPQSGLTMPETLLLGEPLVYIPEETIREALKVILGTAFTKTFALRHRITIFTI